MTHLSTLEEFATAIKDSSRALVVIDFNAEWCGPCKRISPFFAGLAKQYTEIGFYDIDVDNPATKPIVEVCEVKSLPTFCLFGNGKYITNTVGASENDLELMLIENLERINK